MSTTFSSVLAVSSAPSPTNFLSGINFLPIVNKYINPAIVIGPPAKANSKKPNCLNPAVPKTALIAKFGGVPTNVKVPPRPAAKANGIRILPLFQPAEFAIPIQTGNKTAVVPVLLKTDDRPAARTITPRVRPISLPPAIPTTLSPIALATPVSNKPAPTTNIPAKSITFVLDNPERAWPVVETPVQTNNTGTVIAVTANGISSVTKKNAANARISKVLLIFLLFFAAAAASSAAISSAVIAGSAVTSVV